MAMRHGRRAGVQFGLGLALGLTIWGLLAASGMGAVLQTSETVLIVLKIAGAAYLFWLALQSGRAAAAPHADLVTVSTSGRYFRQGLILNLSNPKAVFAWMAALAMGLDADAGLHSVALATALCAVIGLGNYMGWAYLFSLSPAMRLYQKVRRWFEGAASALFALGGFGLIRSAFSR
jgi:threonine/homoserine/homoserine lactone efflux protein